MSNHFICPPYDYLYFSYNFIDFLIMSYNFCYKLPAQFSKSSKNIGLHKFWTLHVVQDSTLKFFNFVQALSAPMGKWGKTFRRCFVFLVCLKVCYDFFEVYIIPKWLIKVPGHIPILFWWFWELRKFGKNIDPCTS